MIPTVFASAYTAYAFEILHRRPDHRPGRDAGADRRPDRRRHHHRLDVVARLFFINVIPGIGITIGVLVLVDFNINRISRCSIISTGGASLHGGAFSVR